MNYEFLDAFKIEHNHNPSERRTIVSLFLLLELELDGNMISVIHKGAFSDLASLRSLRMKNNNILCVQGTLEFG